METFSNQLSQWLSRYRNRIGPETPLPDARAGRSLGVASGNLGDVYPFTVPNAMSGLFAVLGISGFSPKTKTVRIIEYRSRNGFFPNESEIQWQKMTGDDWAKITFTDEPVFPEKLVPIHEVDLTLAFDDVVRSTSEGSWHYHSRDLSRLYRLHWWSHPDGLAITAATFRAASQQLAPFLRPRYAAAEDAIVDPACLFPLWFGVKLFGGMAVLTAGNEITLTTEIVPESVSEAELILPANTNVFVSKSADSRAATVRSVCSVKPNGSGNVSLASTGAHRITRQYEQWDPETARAELVPHELFLLSGDTPCCSCDDYVKTYESLRELFHRQEEAIRKYNTVFEILKSFRAELREKLIDRVKPVRVRREKTEIDGPLIRCVLAVVCSNIYETEYEHKNITLRLVSETEGVTIRDVNSPRKRDQNPTVLRFGVTTIELTPIVIPAFSHKAVRLEVLLGRGENDGAFSFTVDPPSEENS